jgi:hypothetical protein
VRVERVGRDPRGGVLDEALALVVEAGDADVQDVR